MNVTETQPFSYAIISGAEHGLNASWFAESAQAP